MHIQASVHVYEYIKVDSRPGELEYMQLCNVSNKEGPSKSIELLNMHVMSASIICLPSCYVSAQSNSIVAQQKLISGELYHVCNRLHCRPDVCHKL